MKTNNSILARFFKFAQQLAGYTGYGLGGLVFISLLLPSSAVLMFMPALRHKILRSVFRLFCRFLTRMYLPGLRIYKIAEIAGYERSRASQPCIYAANHRGRLDGPLLLGTIHNTGVIMKQKYARQPLYSSFVKHLDFVSVDPNSLESLSDALIKCKALLAEGKNILVFPEGVRASSQRLLPFREFSFRIACEEDLPVVPVAIHSDLPFMAKIKGSHFPKRKFTYRIQFLDPLRCGAGETASAFAHRVRQAIAGHLAKLDAVSSGSGTRRPEA